MKISYETKYLIKINMIFYIACIINATCFKNLKLERIKSD